jgi:hypothetical protein
MLSMTKAGIIGYTEETRNANKISVLENLHETNNDIEGDDRLIINFMKRNQSVAV